MKIHNENNQQINHHKIESKEQNLAKEYVMPHDIVLELGARYGSVSCVVNNILDIKTNHVVVEPDDTVWECLKNNQLHNNAQFHIVEGMIANNPHTIVKDGYATKCITNTLNSSYVNCFSITQIKQKYDIDKFTVLIADCEGCLPLFLIENINILSELRLIIFETDDKSRIQYDTVFDLLDKYSFKKIKSFRNHYVFIKEIN